jgi:hypothetical protein
LVKPFSHCHWILAFFEFSSVAQVENLCCATKGGHNFRQTPDCQTFLHAIYRVYDCQSNSCVLGWGSGVYQNPQVATHGGGFAASANSASFRLGLTTPLLDGWLAYEDIVLTGRSSSIPITAGNNYQLTLQLARNLPAAQAARILAHYNTGEIVEPWPNTANYQSGGAAHMLIFTAASTATSIQFQYQVSTANIQRKTYFLGSQAIIARVSGDRMGITACTTSTPTTSARPA